MSTISTLLLNGTSYELGGSVPYYPTDESVSLDTAYIYPKYTAEKINDDGTTSASQTAYTTEFLPVEEGETIYLSNSLTTKVAFYSQSKTFISIASTTAGLNSYSVPAGASFARYQNVLQGPVRPFNVRMKAQPQNSDFNDLIFSPIITAPSICITGDSNTYGYGLSDTANSWANMFMTALVSGVTELKYDTTSKWTECFGAVKYSTASFNYKQNSQMSIWTNANSVTLSIAESYSPVYDWYVDDAIQTSFHNVATLTRLDGNLHKITVKFSGGQAVNPNLVISKTITYTNRGVSGVNTENVQWDSGKDWLIVMIGTNNRTINIPSVNVNFNEYRGKGTFVCPFPNHKTDSSYAYSQMFTYANIARAFKGVGFDVINTDMFANEFYATSELYQGDLIHFNELGHRKIANIVSGLMGFPLCLQEV